MHVNAVIVAAGRGVRAGAEAPKALLPICGVPLVVRTLRCFAAAESIRKVILVAPPEELAKFRNAVQSDPQASALSCQLCAGGPRRQDSVRLGLEKLDPECQVVVIHDGVRPFVSPELIDRAVDVAREKKAVVVGVPVRNTVKVVSALGEVINTLERDSLWEIQTPQVFSVDIIREAYDRGAREGIEATDDAMLVERLGVVVTLLRGETTNIKITFPEDILFAEALLREGRVAS